VNETTKLTTLQRGPLQPFFWFSVLGFLQRGIYLLLLPLYLNYLSPEEIGVFFLVTLAAAIAGVFATLKLDAAMRTFYFDFEDNESRLLHYLTQVFSASLLLAGGFYSIALLLGPAVFSLVFKHSEISYFPFGAIALATVCVQSCLTIYFVYLKNQLRIRQFAGYQLFLILGTMSLQFVLIAGFGLGLIGALIGALVPASMVLLTLLARNPSIVTRRFDMELLRPSLAYSLPLILFGFLFMVEARLDRLAIERYYDLVFVGKYAVFSGILGSMVIFANALDAAIRPFLFRSLGRDGNAATGEVRSYVQLYIAANILGLSMVVFLGSNLAWITDNPSYLSVRSYFVLGATAMLPMMFTRLFSLFYVFYKKSGFLTVWMAVRTLLTALLLSQLVPRYGIEGALLSILISQLANALVFGCELTRHRLRSLPISGVVVQALAFLACIWLTREFFFDQDFALFGVTQLIFVFAFVVLLNRDLYGKLSTSLNESRS